MLTLTANSALRAVKPDYQPEIIFFGWNKARNYCSGWVEGNGDVYGLTLEKVKVSQGKYEVKMNCTCPDHNKRGLVCKHMQKFAALAKQELIKLQSEAL